MTLVLDSGGLMALERADREVVVLLKREVLANRAPATHGGVVGQVWRGGRGRQANLARLLDGVEIVAVDDRLGKLAGILLGRSHSKDVIDAALVMTASDGDEILTSDASDLRVLAAAAGLHVDLIPV